MRSKLCSMLNIEKPIIQGPMAWVSTASLAAAVSNAGGLGVLGVGFAPREIADSQIMETQKLTDKPFAINTVMIPEVVENTSHILADFKLPVVYADSPGTLEVEFCSIYFKSWHEAGAKILVKVSTVAEAKVSEAAGADAIIAKGWEGGGHTSVEATMVLVPLVADEVKIPVIAAGGIADGRGMAAAIALGAEGIEMGTAFMVATETMIAPSVKEEMLKTDDMQTVVIGHYTGQPCRQIMNPLADRLMEIERSLTTEEATPILKEAAASSLKLAMVDGDIENGAVMVGQVVPMLKEIRSAQEIMDSVLKEAKKIIANIHMFDFAG